MILGAFLKEKNTKMFYFCKFYKAMDFVCPLNKFYKAIAPASHLASEGAELASQRLVSGPGTGFSGHPRVKGLQDEHLSLTNTDLLLEQKVSA